MPRPDVDPRISRTRQVVLAAVLDELAAVGHSGFTVESVAARCGVGKSTIYRHWDGKTQLIVDAIETLNTQPTPDVDGSPRERVRRLCHHLTQALSDGTLGAVTSALIEAAERNDEVRGLLHTYAAGRRRALVDAIADGVGSGSVDGSVDPELAAHALAGAIFYARLLTPTPLDGPDIDRLMTTVLGTPPG